MITMIEARNPASLPKYGARTHLRLGVLAADADRISHHLTCLDEGGGRMDEQGIAVSMPGCNTEPYCE